MRTCYKVDVKFYSDTEDTSEIMWYRVPKDRALLPVGTIFGSYNWDGENEPTWKHDPGTVLQGEQIDTRTYYNGEEPFPPGVNGHYCGEPSQWMGDLTLARDGEGVLDADNRPICCGDSPPPPLHPACTFAPEAVRRYRMALPSQPGNGNLACTGMQMVGYADRNAVNACLWRTPTLAVPGPGPTTWVLSCSLSGGLNRWTALYLPGRPVFSGLASYRLDDWPGITTADFPFLASGAG